MAKKPLVTVIIPVFNGMPFLPETLDSVRNQTLTHIEILIVDDGSTDGSLSYVESLNDERITILKHQRKGLCETLNTAINSSQADLIARTDQDDISLPSRLARQVDFLNHHRDIDCVFTNVVKFGRKCSLYNFDKGPLNNKFYKMFDPWIDGNQVHSSILARKHLLLRLGGYRKEFYPADDWDLALRMYGACKVAILNEALVRYRYHSSANTLKHFSAMQEHRRWAEDCYLKRKLGMKESNYIDYRKEANKSIYKVLNRKRKDLSKLLTRKAGTGYLDSDYFSLIFYAILIFMIVPIKFSKRVFWFCLNNFRIFIGSGSAPTRAAC